MEPLLGSVHAQNDIGIGSAFREANETGPFPPAGSTMKLDIALSSRLPARRWLGPSRANDHPLAEGLVGDDQPLDLATCARALVICLE